MPRVQYLACRNCGSEYTVQRRGNSIGLEPFVPEQVEISRQIAEVEKRQGEGCSNVFFWILLVTGVFFCGIGYLSRALFQNTIPFIIGWVLSIVTVVLAAGILLRSLNTQRYERLKLEAKRQDLYEQMNDADEGPRKT